MGGMRTLVIDSGAALRPGPPPAVGSAAFAKDLAEVRQYTVAPTPETTRLAQFYDMTTGGMTAGFWNTEAAALLGGARLSEAQTTAVLAATNMAMMDAVVACHDAKYSYWLPRPSQMDAAIKPLIGLPNHPAYPSNHSCISTAAAHVLAHFFPGQRTRLEGIAKEAGLSRIYAGLHYRFDVLAGEDIGRKVAAAVVAQHARVLAR